MTDLPLTSPTMLNWFKEKNAAVRERELAEDNRAVIESLTNKPLAEPRVKQTFLCRWCLNPVTEVPKSAGEYIQLRAIAMIPDAVLDPPICDSCFYNVIGSYNRETTNIGTSNSGHANMALRHLR